MTTLARSRLHVMMNDEGRGTKRRRRARLAALRWAALMAAVMLLAALQSGCAATSHPSVVEYDYESPNAGNVAAPGRSRQESLNRSQLASAQPAPMAIEPRPSPVKFDIPDDPNAIKETVAPETQRIAEQSQRDVDLLMAARKNGSMPGGDTGLASSGDDAANSTASPALGSSVSPPRRTIQWNDQPQTPPSNVPNPAPGAASVKPTSLPVIPVDAPAPPPSTQPAAPEPKIETDPAVLRPDRIKQLSVDLARELYAQGAYSDHPLRELAVIAAMSMHEKERRLDPAAIPDLTEEERQLLANLQTFFASVGESLDKGSDINAGVALAAATLRQSLVHEPQLKLPTVALCTRVGGFGDYSPFEKNMFLAASDQKAIVYLEVKDFVSDINHNDEFVTELAQQLTIYSDRDGIPVWKEDWLAATDVTRNKRQDFFTTQIITLPKALGVGKYTLKIRVRDEKSKAESETSIGFELVADPKMVQ